MRLLAELGLDCGGKEQAFDPSVRAGCEWYAPGMNSNRKWWKSAPHVIKSPYLSFVLDEAIQSGMQIEHAFVPIRDPQGVGRSRVDNNLFWGGKDREANTKKAMEAIGSSIACCLKHKLPYSILPFPEYTQSFDILMAEFQRIPSIQEIPLRKMHRTFNSLTKRHKELADADAIRRRNMPNKGSAQADS